MEFSGTAGGHQLVYDTREQRVAVTGGRIQLEVEVSLYNSNGADVNVTVLL